MADPIIVAQRRADAMAQLDKEQKALADKLGIDPPKEEMPIARQPDLREVQQLQASLDFIKRVNAAVGGAPKRPAVAAPAPAPAPIAAAPAAVSTAQGRPPKR